MSEMAPALIAIDVDCTAINTEKAFDLFTRTSEQLGVADEAILREARTASEATGGSFDVMGYLLDQGVSRQEIDEIYQVFARNDSGEVLVYDDTLPALQALTDMQLPFFFLTYGGDDWQNAKLRAAGLGRYNSIVTSEKSKGVLINSWATEDGYSIITDLGKRITARSVWLADDKLLSFEGMPEDCVSFLVWRRTVKPQISPEQAGRITVVNDLAQVALYAQQGTEFNDSFARSVK